MLLAVAGVVTLGLVAAVVLWGLRGGDDAAPAASPSPSAVATPLAEVDTSTISLVRGSFCADVDPAAVLGAVGADSDDQARARTWANGQRARLEPGLSDVSHEYGCSWRTASSQTARAWVFAPPVTLDEARDLVAAAPRREGCSLLADAPSFGTPSVAVQCRGVGELTRTFTGLFGDAWLTCQVGAPVPTGGADGPEAAEAAQTLATRASTWCPAVLAAAGS